MHVNRFVCLYVGCEASSSTSKLLEEHGGVHTSSDTSRLAWNNSAVDIASNDSAAVAHGLNTYALRCSSTVDFVEGHVGPSSHYSGLPYPVGDLPVVNDYNNHSYAAWAVTDTAVQRPAGLANEHVAASFHWSDPLDFGENSFLPGGPYEFSKGSVNLTGPVLAEPWDQNIPAAHWHYPIPTLGIHLLPTPHPSATTSFSPDPPFTSMNTPEHRAHFPSPPSIVSPSFGNRTPNFAASDVHRVQSNLWPSVRLRAPRQDPLGQFQSPQVSVRGLHV